MSPAPRKDPAIEVACIVKAVTEKAILIDHGGKATVWIPKSQVTDWCDGPDDQPGLGTTSIFISEWLAGEKGIL